MSHVKRIAIVGPECTGKTTLSKSLAAHYQTNWVPEFARDYLDKLERPYQQMDLKTIARGQAALEDELAASSNRILICDTTLVVVKIWSDVKYQNCDPEIIREMQNRIYDLTLLTYIDIPWENDPQREHPKMREELYRRYVQELNNQEINFVEVSGTVHQRMSRAINAINDLF